MDVPNKLSKQILQKSGGVKYLVAEPFGICFLGLDGKIHEIHGCPLPQLRRLAGLMDIAWAEIKKEFHSSNSVIPQSLFHTNSLFQQICLQIISTCEISSDVIDINMLCQLIFPFQFEGEEVDGLLMQLNFPGVASPSYQNRQAIFKSESETKQSWDDMLAAVWLSSKNLDHAVQVSSNLPWNQLAPTMRSRNDAFADPEKKEREDIMQTYANIAKQSQQVAKTEADQEAAANLFNFNVDFDPDLENNPGFKEFQ